jgi:hypothetical protein
MNDLCENLKNYFEKQIHIGQFSIDKGSINLPFLLNGQYFRIVGSVMNDGVYQYPCSELTDESFRGEVWAMGIPPSLIALLAEINEWQTKYGENAQSPYSSESFAGYSYSKATDSQTGGAMTWQSVFRDRLSRWRKI